MILLVEYTQLVQNIFGKESHIEQNILQEALSLYRDLVIAEMFSIVTKEMGRSKLLAMK